MKRRKHPIDLRLELGKLFMENPEFAQKFCERIDPWDLVLNYHRGKDAEDIRGGEKGV